MSRSVAHSAVEPQGQSCDLRSGERSSTCDPDFIVDLFNEAIDATEWKHKQEALATEMGIDRAYLSRVRSKEKPLSLKILRALPDDIEQIFARLYAASFGLIVVSPAYGDEAVRNLVSGLFGVLAARLPSRSAGQLKSTLPGDR